MGEPANFQEAVWLTIENALRDGLAASASPDLARTLQVPGTPEPPEGVEEWITFWPMTMIPYGTGPDISVYTVMFQISCSSLTADQRADKKRTRPMELESIVRKILQKKSFKIWDIGDQGQTTTVLGVLSTDNPDSKYLAPRQMSASGIPTRAGLGIPVGMHQVALTFRAVTDVR